MNTCSPDLMHSCTQALLGAIPGSQSYMVQGGSHPCYRDDPEGWNAAVIGFIGGL